jgi:hypothetical protein
MVVRIILDRSKTGIVCSNPAVGTDVRKGKVVPVRNELPRYEDVLREWRCACTRP